MKFLSREAWIYFFGRQVDNLKANKQGCYIISDTSFCYLSTLGRCAFGIPELAPPTSRLILDRVAYNCAVGAGIIQGCLESLGYACVVEPDGSVIPPTVSFNIQLSEP